MISFTTIPINILTPGQYVEFDSSRAAQGLSVMPHKILVIAPRLTPGSATALMPTPVRSSADGEQLAGRGSIGAAMLAAVKRANPYTDLVMIGVSDAAGGVAATGTLTVTGPATGSGALQIYIAGTRVSVAIASADAANAMATAIAAAINADSSLPVTAAAVANVVTLTARNKGTVGNDIDLRLNYNTGDTTPPGVAVAVVAMANGATNPDLTIVLAALGDTHYHTVIMPWTDSTNLALLEAWLATRWDGMTMKEAHAFASIGGSYSNGTTVAAGRNSPFLSLMPSQRSPSPPWIVASVLGAVDAGQAQSPSDSNRPRQSLPLVGVLPPRETDRYTRTERNTHLANGAATFLVDDGGVCRIERVVTTYKTAGGVPDTAFQDVEILRGLAYMRYSLRQRIALRFPRHKLADNGTRIAPGQAIVTPDMIRDEEIALAQDWFDVGLIENLEQFNRDVIVERNQIDRNRVDSIIPPDCVNGFRVFAGKIEFRL
jgi:phage tail sheath gpL-like